MKKYEYDLDRKVSKGMPTETREEHDGSKGWTVKLRFIPLLQALLSPSRNPEWPQGNWFHIKTNSMGINSDS